MEERSVITPEAASVIVRLLARQIRHEQCRCEALQKAAVEIKCHRCRVLEDAKTYLREQYLVACEIAVRLGVNK